MAINPGKIPAGAYWSEIQAAVSARATTAEVWQAIQSAHMAATGEVPSFDFQDVTRLRSLAAQNRNAQEIFGRAAPNVAIDSTMIGRIPNAPPPGPLGESRRFIVRFEHNVLRNGEQITEWRTSEFRTGILRTKQSMLNALTQQGAALAEDYENETHLGIGQVSILAA